MKAGAIHSVYIHSPDRLASGVELMVVWDELRSEGAEVIFLRGAVDTSAEGRVFMHMQGAFAEYEKTKIAERTRRGKIHWAEQHALVGYWQPYGYTFVRRIQEHRAHLVVKDEQAAVVRNIFRWTVDDHLSQRQIATRLTAEGIPTARGGRRWKPSVVGDILKNPIYKGTIAFNKTEENKNRGEKSRFEVEPKRLPRPEEEWITWENPELAIIDSETWDRAQRQRHANRKLAPRNNKRNRYLLRGLVRCTRCNGAYSGATDHGVRRYRCHRSSPTVGSPVEKCRPGSVRADALEESVWEAVTDALRDPALLREQFEARIEDPEMADESGSQIRQVELAIKEIERKQPRVLDAYLNEALDLEQFKVRPVGSSQKGPHSRGRTA